MAKELYDLGEAPPLGQVPPKMYAWTVRQDRFGEPRDSWRSEVIDVPRIGDDEVLVRVQAAGINYNNVWAGLGVPVDVIAARNKAGEPEDFHVGGSDASGVVYQVGKDVTRWQVGDEVVVHCGSWDRDDPVIGAGDDPMFAPSFRIWGYETNYGSFAQYTRVQAHQLLPKPRHLTWEAAAAYMLVGATAYRMLMGWQERSLRAGDVALIWGGAGGLGSMAVQIARAAGATPVAVVSSEDKFDYVKALGAKGAINRKDFDHWGMLPHWKDRVGYAEWMKGVRRFGKAIWDVLGEKRNPRIVFEHPGENTIPTSMFVCDTGGMVVICAGTTGFNATVDLRYLWMRQKRLQGSHFANDDQARGLNDLVIEGQVDPCLSRAFPYEELPLAHQMMYENRHPAGNMAVLIGAPGFGLGATAEGPAAAAVAPVLSELGRDELYIPHREVESTEIPIFASDPTLVGEIMHDGVITCPPRMTLDDVARLLVKNHIHAVVVTGPDRQAIGVVSQTDVVLARQGRTPEEIAGLKAFDVMSRSLLSCGRETTVSEAVTTMTRNRVHRLVVTERRPEGKRPVGVISMTDVIASLMGGEAGDGTYHDAN
jgi:crotonyl-CoA carboxylase/reductase